MSKKITVQVDLIIDDDETPDEVCDELSAVLDSEFDSYYMMSRGCEVREMWS